MIEALVGLVVGLAVWVAGGRARVSGDSAVMARLDSMVARMPSRRTSRSRTFFFPAGLSRVLPGDREAIETRLRASGVAWGTDAMVAARYASAILGATLGMLFRPFAIPAAFGLGFLGFRLPDLILSARIRARREEMARDLPDAVDLVAVCTNAGLNIRLALDRVAQGIPGLLGSELKRVIRQMDLGVPKDEALAELKRRTESREIDSFVGVLATSERFGTQVSSSLQQLSDDLWSSRKRAAEEQARRAPVKLLFPLVFLILPGFVLLTLVPLLIGTFQSLGF